MYIDMWLLRWDRAGTVSSVYRASIKTVISAVPRCHGHFEGLNRIK